MSHLDKALRELGFLCGIEDEIYIRDTGKYTSLIIEGKWKGGDKTYTYDFYKQTFYPRRSNSIKVYGKNMRPAQLLDRVEKYLLNRRLYLLEGRTKK